MVQFDVFWAYAFGAGFSMAAFRQLKKKAGKNVSSSKDKLEEKKSRVFDNIYFTKALIYITVLYVPSVMYLLWAFPGWETMHAGTYKTIPPWIVALFVMTIPLFFMLGFWVTSKLILAQKYYAAGIQTFIGYFFMFFFLVNGWDKTGYKRFFSVYREDFLNWPSGFSEQIAAGKAWVTSDVGITFTFMGVILIPVLFYMLKWFYEGYETGYILDKAKREKVNPFITSVLLLLGVFGGSLGFAIIASVLVAYTGWILGLLIFIVLAYFLGYKLFFPFICRWLMLVEESS